MTEPASSQAGKPRTSPVRNIIGLVVLVAVLVIGWLEYSAKSGYNKAVTALDARFQNENQGLMSNQEAESLLGKSPDSSGEDVHVEDQTFRKKTYTWRGLFKSYKLAAFYSKQKDSPLHHYETEGAQLPPKPTDVGGDPAPHPLPAAAPSDPAAPVDKKEMEK
jgi:hypothetical protein